MSESFKVKIKISDVNPPTRECIFQLAAALGESDYAEIRQIATKALAGIPDANRADDLSLDSLALLPCSEYGPAKVPFLDALCGALEDAGAYLHVTGSRKVTLELSGTDNGTADAAAYLIALLHRLTTGELDAKGKGFTWMAHWLRDAMGGLRIASYEPLEEGQKIDPKAEEKMRRQVQKDNTAFLASPLRKLVEALPLGMPMALVEAVALDQFLGFSYDELMEHIAALPDRTGRRFRVGVSGQALKARDLSNQLTIDVWNAPGDKQSLELDLRADFPLKRVRQHFKTLPYAYTNPGVVIGHYRWESGDVQAEARTSQESFELRLTRPSRG